MFGLGHTEIILIVVAIVILFGATKIPALGSSIGQGIRNFRRGIKDAEAEKAADEKQEAEKKALAAGSAEDKVEVQSAKDVQG